MLVRGDGATTFGKYRDACLRWKNYPSCLPLTDRTALFTDLDVEIPRFLCSGNMIQTSSHHELRRTPQAVRKVIEKLCKIATMD